MGVRKFFILKPNETTITRTPLNDKFENLVSLNNIRFEESFQCFRSYDAWQQMIMDNSSLFKSVYESLFEIKDAESRSYSTLPASMLEFVGKQFGNFKNPLEVYGSFQPS